MAQVGGHHGLRGGGWGQVAQAIHQGQLQVPQPAAPQEWKAIITPDDYVIAGRVDRAVGAAETWVSMHNLHEAHTAIARLQNALRATNQSTPADDPVATLRQQASEKESEYNKVRSSFCGRFVSWLSTSDLIPRIVHNIFMKFFCYRDTFNSLNELHTEAKALQNQVASTPAGQSAVAAAPSPVEIPPYELPLDQQRTLQQYSTPSEARKLIVEALRGPEGYQRKALFPARFEADPPSQNPTAERPNFTLNQLARPKLTQPIMAVNAQGGEVIIIQAEVTKFVGGRPTQGSTVQRMMVSQEGWNSNTWNLEGNPYFGTNGPLLKDGCVDSTAILWLRELSQRGFVDMADPDNHGVVLRYTLVADKA